VTESVKPPLHTVHMRRSATAGAARQRWSDIHRCSPGALARGRIGQRGVAILPMYRVAGD